MVLITPDSVILALKDTLSICKATPSVVPSWLTVIGLLCVRVRLKVRIKG